MTFTHSYILDELVSFLSVPIAFKNSTFKVHLSENGRKFDQKEKRLQTAS